MKRRILFLTILSLILTSCHTNGNESTMNQSENSVSEIIYDTEAAIYFDTSKANPYSINPLIYGTFIEHIESCIYNGLWSELILDRKFYQPIEMDVSQWRMGGNKEVFSQTTKLVSPGYAPHIKAGSSIFQRGIALDEKEYVGYFYGLGSSQLKITLANSNEQISKNFTLSSTNFEKFEFTFNSSFRNPKTTLTFEVLSGEAIIDSVSLMPSDNYFGMRRDTLEQLRHLQAPIIRWPGGNFVSGYDFYDGIGRRDTRPTKRNLHYIGDVSDFSSDSERLASDIMKIGNLGFYGAFEPNDFGIDEFIELCRFLETEPNLVLNSGLGTVQDAINEIEYTNGTSGEYAQLRPQTEPYGIKYISIGNEMNGTWQLGYIPINQYVAKHNQIAEAIKVVDPNIVIIGVGDNASNWSSTMLNGTRNNLNMISEHFYAERKENDVSAHILSMKQQAEMRTSNHRNIMGNSGVTISFDEYAYLDAEQESRLKDGLGVASALNVFLKNSDIVDIACYSSTINATQGSITTTNYSALMQGNGYVLSLYSRFMESYYMPLTFNKRNVDGYFEVTGALSQDKKTLTLSVINASSQTIKLTNSKFTRIESIHYVTADYLESINQESNRELFEYELMNPALAVSYPRSLSIITISI